MSYGKEIASANTKTLFTMNTATDSTVGASQTLYSNTFDFSTLAVGEGYEIRADFDISNVLSKTISMSIGGYTVISMTEASQVGGYFRCKVIKTSAGSCFIKVEGDFNSSPGIDSTINTYGGLSTSIFFATSTAIVLTTSTTGGAAEYTLQGFRILKFKLS